MKNPFHIYPLKQFAVLMLLLGILRLLYYKKMFHILRGEDDLWWGMQKLPPLLKRKYLSIFYLLLVNGTVSPDDASKDDKCHGRHGHHTIVEECAITEERNLISEQ